MTGPVEAVLFDIDDTLCEYRQKAADLLDHSFGEVGVEPFFTDEEYYAVFEDYIDVAEDTEEIRELSFAGLAEEKGVDPEVGREVAGAYAAARDHRDVRFLDGAEEALETMGERYPLAAVTNGDPEMQSAKLDSLGIDDHFETVVYAGFDTAAKPDPAPFEQALDVLGVTPDRAVKIGNSLEHDVLGAQNAGLTSIWLDRDGVADPDPEPHYRIESMRELLDEPWE
ncbi:HAD-IA family hydrolase [Halomicrobium mukohataei]|uniref:HAD-IA family hydrolase n=1 Tax=Halomicrobium mukohataei TaxID=57705 RepID=A0A847UCZ0_9EURY|nr:HAD family hydrolase [Halomicrobium mukohataei]NLV10087.1 HAD-IA family hydrolase [Halomicrobium mukohataei]